MHLDNDIAVPPQIVIHAHPGNLGTIYTMGGHDFTALDNTEPYNFKDRLMKIAYLFFHTTDGPPLVPVVVKVDDGVPSDDVKVLLDAVRQAGFPDSDVSTSLPATSAPAGSITIASLQQPASPWTTTELASMSTSKLTAVYESLVQKLQQKRSDLEAELNSKSADPNRLARIQSEIVATNIATGQVYDALQHRQAILVDWRSFFRHGEPGAGVGRGEGAGLGEPVFEQTPA